MSCAEKSSNAAAASQLRERLLKRKLGDATDTTQDAPASDATAATAGAEADAPGDGTEKIKAEVSAATRLSCSCL